MVLAERQATGRTVGTASMPERRSFWEFFQQMRRVRMAVPSAAVLLFFLLLAALADVVAPVNPMAQDLGNGLRPPSPEHLLGTDELGRDVLSRVILGSRVSMEVGVLANLLALALGVPLGLIAGYSRNMLDSLIMRIMDGLLAFPVLILAIAIAAALGPSLANVIIAVGAVQMPFIARLARGVTLSVREQEFVLAAVALGARDTRILLHHILPNIIAPIMVQTALSVSFAIVAEASLSFLGVGIQPPQPSWGNMLQTGYRYIEIAPWLVLTPGVGIFLTVLAFNFLGDGFRDALDPRMRKV